MKYNVVLVGEQNILVFLNRPHSAFKILNMKYEIQCGW